ncbi:GORK [Symbiodinium necroappetens]|uniref:GORK protein n=1 Tax=Symbiodinium necroappetens TaxID=1628268 RepID=A0A813AYN2_9DINO|nr:GORK [Symbiodinium necroappetens]
MSAKLVEMDRAGLVKALSAMGVYDNKLLLASVSLLGTEVVPSYADQMATRYCFRISSTSFAPPAPPQGPGPAKNVPTKATETSKETEEGDLSPNNDRAELELANEKVAEGIQQAFI